MHRRNCSGFSLVEVLIALVVMSVGMLGMASLYVKGLQAGRTSVFSHHAVTLAGDVADRIRANPGGGEAYEDDGVDNDCVLGGINCSAPQMAANDVYLWKEQAAETLPGGDVTIIYDDGMSPPTYSISVSWSEPGAEPTYDIIIPVLDI